MKRNNVKYRDTVLIAECDNCKHAQQQAIQDMQESGTIVLVMDVNYPDNVIPVFEA